jgi:hypothetical protein
MCTSRHGRPRRGGRFSLLSFGSLLALGALLGASLDEAAAQPVMIMAMGQAGGQPDDVVKVDLTLLTVADDSGDPLRVAGLDLTLEWDPTLAVLEGLSLTEATESWILAANPSAGGVVVSMATIEPTSATPTGLPVLSFTFRLLEKMGQTPLHLADTRAFDVDQNFVEHVRVDGKLDVGIVANGWSSMGRLKSVFGAVAPSPASFTTGRRDR